MLKKKISRCIAERSLLSILLLITGLIYMISTVFPSAFNLCSSNRFSILDNRELCIEGTISDVSIYDERAVVTLCNISKPKGLFRSDEKILIYLKSEFDTLKIGYTVNANGVFSLFDSATDPGQFDLRNYYDHRKIPGKLSDAGIKILDIQSTSIFLCGKAIFIGLKNTLVKNAFEILGDEDGGVLAGMVLGEHACIPDEIYALYQNSGIAHLLAVSGLHVSLVGMQLFRFLRKRRRSFMVSGSISTGILLIYCLMTGMGISALRAFTMFAVWILAQITGRKTDTPTVLGIAVFVIAAADPGYLHESSFYLSFGCVCSIYISGVFIKKHNNQFVQSFRISLSIMLGTLPIVSFYFYQISVFSVLTNLIIIPLMALLFSMGILSLFAGIFCSWAAVFLSGICRYILLLYKLICTLQVRLPGAVWITGRPSGIQVILYYSALSIALFTIRKKKSMRKGLIACGGFLLTLLYLIFFNPNHNNQVAFLDVGQGDCILIMQDGMNAIVDCGSSSVGNVWSKRVESTLKYYGIRKLDYVFLTHADADHINGIESYLEKYQKSLSGANIWGISLDTIVLSENEKNRPDSFRLIREKAANLDIDVLYMKQGEKIAGGTFSVEMLFPTEDCNSEDENERSMVLHVRIGNVSFVLTGDMENDEENEFFEMYEDFFEQYPICILKAGHHGSKNATSYELLDALRPIAAVISCGKNNRYGHPSEQVLTRLYFTDTKVLRTDQQGAVIFNSKGDNYTFAGN